MKRIILCFFVIVAFSLISLLAPFISPNPCEAGWKKKNLGGGGGYNSIALDTSGSPHISYQDDSNPEDYVLRHAFSNGRTWKTEVVDSGNVGWYSSIKIDFLGHIHIGYHTGQPTYSLKYAFFDGTSWVKTILESGGYSTSIAVDGNNRPHVSHITGGSISELRYVYHNGTAWVTESVAQDALWFGATSLALTPSNAAYIAFSDSSSPRRLYLATNVSGSWEINYLGDGLWSSLALDSLGNPHILYYSEGTQELKYTRYNGFGWFTESVNQVADSPRLALDRFDHAHMSFGGASADGPDVLVYAYHNGKNWLATLVQKSSGYDTSIAVNNRDYPILQVENHVVKIFPLWAIFIFLELGLRFHKQVRAPGM